MVQGRLVPSTISGRYAIGNAETGADLSSGMVIDVCIAGRWVRGSVEHGMKYDGPGCYSVSDAGRSQCGKGPRTEAELRTTIQAAMQRGLSLEQAVSAVEYRVKEVFCGYYLAIDATPDGSCIGLCTGMLVRLPGRSS